MIAGMTPLVLFHTIISLAGIAAGFVAMAGMLANERRDHITGWFLVLTVLTSATGFVLPASKFMPSHAVGVLSLVILAVAGYARYATDMDGGWRATFVATAIAAQYFNVFVLVIQLFLKVPALHALAPEGTEPPFAVTQGVVVLAFVAIGVLALRRFHPVRR